MKNLLHCTTANGRETFINVDSIRYIQAIGTGTKICVESVEHICIDAPIEEVMNAMAEAMRKPEDA